MQEEVLLFAWSVIRYWGALLTGGVIIALIGMWEHFNGEPIHWRVLVAVMALALLVSTFLAWREAYRAIGATFLATHARALHATGDRCQAVREAINVFRYRAPFDGLTNEDVAFLATLFGELQPRALSKAFQDADRRRSLDRLQDRAFMARYYERAKSREK